MNDWLGLATADWKPSYPFNSQEVVSEVRSTLLVEQSGLCVYCGRRLNTATPGTTYHIEHFRPRSAYPELSCDFKNLFLSCGTKNPDNSPSKTCGNHKENWFDEEHHIAPYYPECARHFKCILTGHIEPNSLGDQAAINMIDKLNLNHPEFIKLREKLLELIDNNDIEFKDLNVDGSWADFSHIAAQHLGLEIT